MEFVEATRKEPLNLFKEALDDCTHGGDSRHVTLSNGVKAPVLGIGTFMITPDDTVNSVYAAIKMGYRLIDTANAYMNEEAVGKAVKRASEEGLVKREDLFISTKLWPTLYENDAAVENTLKRLDMDYVDLLFIHQPSGNYMAGYRQLEKAYKEGKAKAIGFLFARAY